MNRSGRYVIRWKARLRQLEPGIPPSLFCVRSLIADTLGYHNGDAAYGSWDTRRLVPKAGALHMCDHWNIPHQWHLWAPT